MSFVYDDVYFSDLMANNLLKIIYVKIIFETNQAIEETPTGSELAYYLIVDESV